MICDHRQPDEALDVGDPYSSGYVIGSRCEFGSRLSQATLEYGDLAITEPADDVEVSVIVTNAGFRSGREAVVL
jgi:hypothetical protein